LQLSLLYPGVYQGCVIAIETLKRFSQGFGNLADGASNSFCDNISFPETPTSVEIQVTVESFGEEQFTLGNAVEIQSTGDTVRNDSGPYTLLGDCISSTVPPYTCATAMAASSTTTSPATSTAGGACNAIPTIVDGGFEDGVQSFLHYGFPFGGVFQVICGIPMNGLGAPCGDCFG
jgi:hypothetical protein